MVKLHFIIQDSQDNYTGTLTFVNTNYAATAKIKEGILVGSFTSNTSKFLFEAFLEGDTLSFTTEGKNYSLINDAFWDYKTILMRSQDNMRTNHSPEVLGELARNYVPELDEEELVTCIGEERFAEDINNDKAVGEKNLISSTPAIFVNGGQVEKDGWSDPSLPPITTAIENALNMLATVYPYLLNENSINAINSLQKEDNSIFA